MSQRGRYLPGERRPAGQVIGLLTYTHFTGAHVSELGDMLRSARQKRGISLGQASQDTHIKPTYLGALEDGEYDLIPGPAYITGFLRNYAGYLGLHPDDVVQEFYAQRPLPQPSVKAATRVLAHGHRREIRTRLLWTVATVFLLVAAGFAIKQYNDTYAHPYTPLVVTPANLGATTVPTAPAPVHHATKPIQLRIRALAPTWVRITVDGRKTFEGILRARRAPMRWVGHHAIYVVALDGAHLKVVYDGRPVGLVANHTGLVVDEATPTGWHHVT